MGLFRTGIGPDGRFRMIMPNFVHMSDEDLYSVIAFLRSADPIVQPKGIVSQPQEPSFLGKVLGNTVIKPTPVPTAAVVAPPQAVTPEFGRYLVTGRYKCYDCHSGDLTKTNALEPEQSFGYMAGGSVMRTRDGREIVTRNLTPDPGTGTGSWTEAEFVQAVKFGMSPHGPLRYPMPKYSLMTDDEAKAIFAYLRTLPPVQHATPEDGPVVAGN